MSWEKLTPVPAPKGGAATPLAGRELRLVLDNGRHLAYRFGETELTLSEDGGAPVRCPYGAEELSEAALSDKKRAGGTITLVLPEDIGRCVLKKIPVAELPRQFERALVAQEELAL